MLVEFDGAVKYREGTDALLAEKPLKEDAVPRAGWVIVRLVWRDLSSPGLVRQRVHAAMATASAG